MAKAPVAGYAKTRLIPALGADGAAKLALALLQHAVAQARQAALGPVDLCCAPDTTHPALAALAQGPVHASTQATGNLGARMAQAFACWLPGQSPVLMTGTDCPALDAALLRQAAALLSGPASPDSGDLTRDAARHAASDSPGDAPPNAPFDAVFVPALDGGYALIGLRGPPARFAPLFTDMPWSTPALMAQTRLRLAQAGLRHVELPALPDIDEPADLAHLPPALRQHAGLAPDEACSGPPPRTDTRPL